MVLATLPPPQPTETAAASSRSPATQSPQCPFWTQKDPKQSVWLCFPDSVRVELCFLFVENVKSYSKMEPAWPTAPGATTFVGLHLPWFPRSFSFGCEGSAPLTPKHTGRGRLLEGLSEGWRSLRKFSSYLPRFGLGLDAGFYVKHRFKCMQSVCETPPRQRGIFQALVDLQGVKNGKAFFST